MLIPLIYLIRVLAEPLFTSDMLVFRGDCFSVCAYVFTCVCVCVMRVYLMLTDIACGEHESESMKPHNAAVIFAAHLKRSSSPLFSVRRSGWTARDLLTCFTGPRPGTSTAQALS